MPTVAGVAVLALQTLIDDLRVPSRHMDGTAASRAVHQPRVLAARTEALNALADADRLDLLESAAERLAVACIEGEVAPAVRTAAYHALLALVAADLIPQATFATLYEAWEEGTHGGSGTGAVLRGEELLLTLD